MTKIQHAGQHQINKIKIMFCLSQSTSGRISNRSFCVVRVTEITSVQNLQNYIFMYAVSICTVLQECNLLYKECLEKKQVGSARSIHKQ